jgi:agmatinase
MIKTIINTKKAAEADVVFVTAAYEKTASSHKGTAAGPKAVIEQLNTQIEFFDRTFKKNVNDFVKIAHEDMGNLGKLTPEQTLKKIHTSCSKLVSAGKFVFLLGGEHAVSLGHFKALAEKYRPKDVTILQIDAHCDLRNDDSDYSSKPSSLAHSTIMRRASELGFPIVQVGIRTYSEDEYKYFSDRKNNITVFEWGNLSTLARGGSGIPRIEQIIASIKTRYLFITIDVDGFDPSHMPGTGTAVQGGLDWWYGVGLIERAIRDFELVGADIVEVSPTKDTVLTEYGAAQLAYTMIANKFESRLR